MSYKFLYQNAQIKSRESKLLTQQGVQRLLDASDTREASRALAELGFGTDGENFDVVFKRAEDENIALLKEMNEGGALDAFLIESDYTNLKILLKAFVSGLKAETFAPDGLFEVGFCKTQSKQAKSPLCLGKCKRLFSKRKRHLPVVKSARINSI